MLLKLIVLVPGAVFFVSETRSKISRKHVETGDPMNAQDPVENHFEDPQVLVIDVQPQEHSLAKQHRCRHSNDPEKGKHLEEVKVEIACLHAEAKADEERNVGQEVKDEQAAKIFLSNLLSAQNDLEKKTL